MSITYSFDAGYDWGIHLGTDSEEQKIWIDGSGMRNSHESVGITTKEITLSADDTYTKLRIEPSSFVARINIYEIKFY